jgi:hypothetical protein
MVQILTLQAGLLGSLSHFFSDRALEALGAILLIAVAILTKRYIVPLLKTAQLRQTAQHILVIADDVTDYFRSKFPTAHWSVWLDRAVDKIIEITGVGREPAERAARAAIARKQAGPGGSSLEGKS